MIQLYLLQVQANHSKDGGFFANNNSVREGSLGGTLSWVPGYIVLLVSMDSKMSQKCKV